MPETLQTQQTIHQFFNRKKNPPLKALMDISFFFLELVVKDNINKRYKQIRKQHSFRKSFHSERRI